MRTHIRFIGIAAVAAIALLLPLSAHAVCGTDTSFGGYYSFVVGTNHAPSLRSSFWTLGSGSPINGAGNDNGSVNDDLWVVPYQGGWIVFGGWAQQTYDGCPDLGGAPATQRMAFAFSDLDGTGNMTYAVECVHRDVTAGRQFGTDLPPGCTAGACQQINMVAAPKATVTGTTRAAGNAQITIASPDFSAGFYSDGSAGCELNTVIPQFDVYKQEIARNAVAPTNRDISSWTLAGTGNIGTPFVLTTTCVSDCDVYLALVPHYKDNFNTGEPATGAPARVGANSTKIQAGPTLANPPKPRVITNTKKAE